MDEKPQIVEQLAQTKLQDYIVAHTDDDEKQLILRMKDVGGVPMARVAEQIKARRKAKEKLPLWFSTRGIVYPPGLNLEQSSSEITAAFKTTIVKEMTDSFFSMADLTGGFGVDAYHFSRIFKEVDFVEPNEFLLRVAQHNHQLLGAGLTNWFPATAAQFMTRRGNHDFVFVDPSRRDDNSKKVVRLSDCEPDITQLQRDVLSRADLMMVKASPLLDITQGISEILQTKVVYVVAVDNEVRELLFIAEKGFTGAPEVRTVNLRTTSGFGIVSAAALDRFAFYQDEEKAAVVEFGPPGTYLYEPNASIMKAGAFKLVAVRFGLRKLQANTHLYTGGTLVKDFPGRIFTAIEATKPDRTAQARFPNGQANIISRNYPLTVDEIKKKTGLVEGGDLYLICFSGEKEKWSVVCKRIK